MGRLAPSLTTTQADNADRLKISLSWVFPTTTHHQPLPKGPTATMPTDNQTLPANPSNPSGSPLPEGWDVTMAWPPMWTTAISANPRDPSHTTMMEVYPTHEAATQAADTYNAAYNSDDPAVVEACAKAPRMFVRMATWRERQDDIQAKLCANNLWETVEKTFPVWQQARFWRDNYPVHQDHYLHVSVRDRRLMAYFQDETKACRGIFTPIKPGKYLTKFFGEILTAKQIAAFAAWQATGTYEDALFSDSQLLFARTPEEIEEVYTQGPTSCMSSDGDEYHSSTHPCRVYGAGDLAVAYIEAMPPNKHPRKIAPVARALCWPERKIFSRVYPNTCSWNRDGFESMEQSQSACDTLVNKLRAEGYVHENESEENFNGARLLRIPARRDGVVIMPYIDHYGFSQHPDRDKRNTYFVMSDTPQYSAESTGGAVNTNGGYDDDDEEDDDTSPCEHCEERVENYELDAVVVSVNASGHARRTGSWCRSCRDDDTWTCEATDNVMSDAIDRVDLLDGRTVSRAWAETNCTKCAYLDEWFDGEVCEVWVAGELQEWSRDALDEHGFTCEITGRCYPNTEEHADWTYVWQGVERDALIAYLLDKGEISPEEAMAWPDADTPEPGTVDDPSQLPLPLATPATPLATSPATPVLALIEETV